MNADETAAALAYANGIDGRVTITPARHDLWAIKLAHLPAKAVRAGDAELARNPRARSATLRSAVRTDAPASSSANLSLRSARP